ncbi:ABC transporter ATP-binding protein [Butyricimonas sp. Marseille-P3923]|uniref:ABC transporter ATP-binding protein n=1 Tax=Butyricimonas sp. Marseille-P3923 TaxID=1987504 RepID=UPI000C072718|nr:ABC transporter ATP-binding protein [Butyricimonas sp. Marseille-P3923]
MEDCIVKVEHVSHRYTVQWAVNDISFEIPRNGIYGMLGSNGAGKSTLMNILCGVLRQTKGDVFINGVNTREHPIEAKKHIGFMPQQPPLYNDITVEEYLSYAADLRHIPQRKVKEAVKRVLALCDITHFRNRLIKNLSGGYQQRVSIAQALVHKPALVIFDEPTNGLDPNQILEIRNLIKTIAKDCTVILSTHILKEIQAICDHILMIGQGKLVFSGTVEEFDNYIEPDTLLVTLRNAPSVSELLEIEGVKEVEEIGSASFRIYFTQAQEVMDRLIARSATQHWAMTEIRLEKSSLERIFAELSQSVQ